MSIESEVGRHYAQDRLLQTVLDGFAAGKPPKPGSQIGRQASAPLGGPTTLKEKV